MIAIDWWIAAQVLGLVLLAFFLRGVYLIYRADTTKAERVRAQVSAREGREYKDDFAYHRRIVSEADGRVYLLKRKFWQTVDRLRGWRS